MKERILVVDDELPLLELVDDLLSREGYQVEKAATGAEALKALRRRVPALLILDVQLPDISGVKLCETLRRDPALQGLPVIMLTVMGNEYDKVRGLKTGADDYVTKPFSPLELAARVEAILRRSRRHAPASAVLQAMDMTVDTARREVRVKDKPVALRRREYDLLVLLMKHRGRVLTRLQIAQSLWDEDTVPSENTLNVHVNSLRRRLGPCGVKIKTLVGDGFKFDER